MQVLCLIRRSISMQRLHAPCLRDCRLIRTIWLQRLFASTIRCRDEVVEPNDPVEYGSFFSILLLTRHCTERRLDLKTESS
jgi:hypothetical protein